MTMKLDKIKVQSFVTDVDVKQKEAIIGGTAIGIQTPGCGTQSWEEHCFSGDC